MGGYCKGIYRRLLRERLQAKIDFGNKCSGKNIFTISKSVFHADFKYVKMFL